MFRGEVESDAVSAIPQEGLPRGHVFQMPRFSLLAEILFDAAQPGREADDAFGQMGVEVVADDLPACGVLVGGEQCVKERHEIGFGAGVANPTLDGAGGDIEGGDQSLGSVPDIFEFAPLHLPRLHRQGWGGPLQRLNPGHLVNGNGTHAFGGRGRRFDVYRANLGALALEIRIGLGREPVPDPMRLKRCLFLKNARPSRVRYWERCRAPRLAAPVRSGSNG